MASSSLVSRFGFPCLLRLQFVPPYLSLPGRVFGTCVLRPCIAPYTAPHREYFSTEDLVKGPLPQFAYQLHLASGEVEKSVKDEQSIRQFLRGMYGARGPNGELAFDPEKGVIKKNLPTIGESRILNGKVSLVRLCQVGPSQAGEAFGKTAAQDRHCCLCQ